MTIQKISKVSKVNTINHYLRLDEQGEIINECTKRKSIIHRNSMF